MHIVQSQSNHTKPANKKAYQPSYQFTTLQSPKPTIMKYLSLLALVSASVVSAQTLNRSFTINLLTGDQYLSVVKLPLENQTPIGFGNATIQTVYNEITYSVVGSFDFTELNIGQAFHIDNDLWSVDVSPP